MEFYSTIKSNEVLSHATTWMNPEDIMSCEIIQTHEPIYYMIPFT